MTAYGPSRVRLTLSFPVQVFFFIDPEILDDPAMDNVNTITLSYTFFKTGEEEPEEDRRHQARQQQPRS